VSEILTLRDASRYLKVHTSTLYRLAEQGKVPVSKIGKIWRFKKEDIDEWLEQSKVNSNREKLRRLSLRIQTKDRRRQPRSKINLFIEVKSKSNKIIPAQSINISERGIKLSLKESLNLPERTILNLDIPFPPYVVELPSKTVWSRRYGRNLQPFYGMQFKELERKQSANLKRLLWLCHSFIENNITFLLQKANDVNPQTCEKVRNFFKKDVKSYLDGLCKIQSEMDKNILPEEEGQVKINDTSHEIARKGLRLEEEISNRLVTKEIKKKFREMVGSWAYESEIMRRGYEKPRGYPGDYKLLEQIYDNREITEGVGRYFDRFFLDNPYAEAVRNRRIKMLEILQSFFNKCTLDSVKILNLASGSCREIKELFEKGIEYRGDANINCVDHDEKALDYSKGTLTSLPHNIKMQFIKENILKFPENPEHYVNLFGEQNLIYSIGLIDYLPDRILKNLLRFCLNLLASKGQLIVTHKDKDRDQHAPVPPDWFCDWKFVTRNEEHLINIVKDSIETSDFIIKTERDKTGKIIFLFAEKQSN
jgi:excisionase family DNA binding protein